MSIVTYPLNGIVYDADDVATYLCTRTSGVYSRESNFAVTVTGAREVTVSPGLAWMNYDDFKGVSVCAREAIALTVPDSDASLGRIDRLVLQFDLDANLSALKVKAGTPAATPAPPEIVQTHHIYELGLATISVPAGSVVISEADITDTRMDESVCGVMRDGVTSIPTAQLQAEARAKVQALEESATASAKAAASSASAAAGSATTAGTYADNAAGSAETAANKASAASSSAAAAKASETNAAGSASTASAKAEAASSSESSAKQSAQAAASAAQEAATEAAAQTRAALCAAVQENADAAAASASAAAASEANAAESERISAEYMEQVKTITTGANGYYATPEALQAAVPLGSDGWWAVVGSTDTIWVWDSDSSDWVDSHDMTQLGEYYTRGQVDALVSAAKSVSYTIAVPASGWTGTAAPYANTVTVAGVTADTTLSAITLAPAFVGNSDAEAAAQTWSYLDTGAGTVTFYSDTKPTADFTIIAREVK